MPPPRHLLSEFAEIFIFALPHLPGDRVVDEVGADAVGDNPHTVLRVAGAPVATLGGREVKSLSPSMCDKLWL